MTDSLIEFHFHETKKPAFFTVKKTENWISKNLKNYSVKMARVSFVFVTDEYQLTINKQFLQHDDYTDIITFDNTLDSKHIIGEIYISLDRVKENAKIFKTTYSKELHRVMAHGILHLLGFKDKSAQDKETMRAEEEKWIAEI